MVDSEKIAKYITELETHIKHAQELRKISKQEFLSDWRVYELVERKMHLIFEMCWFMNIFILTMKEYTNICKVIQL